MSRIGLVFLNMGGPETAQEVNPFLRKLFSDKDIIKLPLQSIAGPVLAYRRTPKVLAQYQAIDFSPLAKWSKIQGKGVVDRLNEKNLGSFSYYLAHRYSPNYEYTAEFALKKMEEDKVTKCVVVSMYPQYSCTTTGSSLSDFWRQAKLLNSSEKMEFSVIDRWWNDSAYVEAIVNQVFQGLKEFDHEDVHIVFSAHSLPIRTVEKGDQYVPEIAATCASVMSRLQILRPGRSAFQYTLGWQSKVGPLPWMGPPIGEVITHLAKGKKNILVVPLGFISDHIETLYELDVTYKTLAEEKGIQKFVRAPSLNDSPYLLNAMAGIIEQHLTHLRPSSQYHIKCIGCENELCRLTKPL